MKQRYIVLGAVLVLVLAVGTLASTHRIRTVDSGDSDEGPLLNSASSTPIITMPPIPEIDTTFVPSSREFTQNDAPTSSAKPSTTSLAPICAGKTNDFECYQDYYTALVQHAGATAAFKDLKTRYESNPYVKAQCHPLTHVIGRVAADKFENVGDAYAQGDGFCWSGYYHGVLESFVGKIGLDNLAARINDVCSSIKDKQSYGFDYYNCVHGLGHGIMAITDDELFTSFSYCDRLNGAWEQESCASGAYMENVIVDGLNHFTKYLRSAEPLYPCTESPDKYKRTCYLMQTSYVLKVNGGNFKNLFTVCAGAEEAYRDACFEGLGRDASGRSSSDISQTKSTCLLGDTQEERTHCAIGAVKDFISYFHSDIQGKAFCNAFEDADIASTCLSTATDYYKLL